MMRFRSFALMSFSAFLLAGCTAERQLEMDGQFWQRKDASSAIWLQGPKAQQTLNRDISRCVVEVRELVRLGAIKSATPPEKLAMPPAQQEPEYRLNAWETPERDGFLVNEPQNYDDFETCMLAKGWERVEYLPHKLEDTARANYRDTHVRLKQRSEYGVRQKEIIQEDKTYGYNK